MLKNENKNEKETTKNPLKNEKNTTTKIYN